MPDGVEERHLVVSKEIGSDGVEHSLAEEQEHRQQRHSRHDLGDNEQNAPPHGKVYGKGKTWPFANGKNLIERATYDGKPLQAEHEPTEPSAYESDAYRSIGAGYHHVYADMVKLSQHILNLTRPHPMVKRAGKEHQEHAGYEKQYAESPLPSLMDSGPHHPDAGKGKDSPCKMRPRTALITGE